MYGESLVSKAFEIKYKNKLLFSSSQISIEERDTLQIIQKSVHLIPSTITSFTLSTMNEVKEMIELIENGGFLGIKEIQIRSKLELGIVVSALSHMCIPELSVIVIYLIANDYLEINPVDIEPLFKYRNFTNLKHVYVIYSNPKFYYTQLLSNKNSPSFEFEKKILEKKTECDSFTLSYLNDHLYVISQKQEANTVTVTYQNVFGRRICCFDKNEPIQLITYGGKEYEMNIDVGANYTYLTRSIITVEFFISY